MHASSVFGSLNGSAGLVTVAFVALLFLVCLSAFVPRMDPQEPQTIKPRIPLIGHIFGLFYYQIHYFDMLNARYGLPIYTLPMLTGKTYVVASPDLMQSILRVKNGLSVEPFMIDVVGKNLSDQSPEAMKVWSHISKDKSEPYLIQEMSKTFAKQMTLGPQLYSLNLAGLNKFSALLDSICIPKEENLYLWLRNAFTISTTTALYGPDNPMALDPHLCNAQWAMEARSLWVFTGFFNKFLFPHAFAGRAAMQAVHWSYHSADRANGPGVSGVIRNYVNLLRRYGLASSDIGKADVSIIHGSTSNAALAFYWLVVYIFADPTLLKDVRTELLAVTTEREGEKKTTTTTTRTPSGRREMIIDISRVAHTCPLLYAVHQEILRLQTFSLVTRSVAEDTKITDAHGTAYLLKAGAILQMPVAVAQAAPEIWGPDAHVFNARRFLKTAHQGEKQVLSEAEKEREKAQRRAYLPFSGGVHMCPGRHFATAEHLGMIAMLVLGFEITTAEGKGIAIPRNPEGQRGVSSGVAKPNSGFMKLQVKVARRKGLEDVEWRFKVAEEKLEVLHE